MFRKDVTIYFENVFDSINIVINYLKLEDSALLKDAIFMRLQIIGENIDKINKYDSKLLKNVSEIDSLIALRHKISHHYESLNYLIVYKDIKKKLILLKRELKIIYKKINK